MAIEIINVGASPNDGNGDPIRDAFIKCNDNFDELDTTKIAGSGTDNFVAKFSGTDSIENSLIFDDGSFVGVNTTTPSTTLEVSGIDYSFSAGRQASNRKVSIGLNDNGQPSIQSFDSSNAPVNLTINPSGGNVGMGTLNPSQKLDVNGMAKFGSILTNGSNGSGGQEAIRINNDNGYIGFFNSANSVRSGYLQGNTTDVTLTTSLSTPLIFGTANTERMRILSNGNVGIGTSDVDSRLKVELINVASLRVAYNGTSVNYYDANENIFRNGSGSERMRITSGGNVGIGTTIADYRTQIETNSANVFLTKNTSSTSFNRSYFHNNNNIGTQFLNFGSAYGFGTEFGVGQNGSVLQSNTTSAFAIGTSTATPFYLGTNGTERMRITSSGNVGIGTTDFFENAKLTLQGGLVVRSGAISNAPSQNAVVLDNAGGISRLMASGASTWNAVLAINPFGGNVGIGTTSPGQKLDVRGNIYTNGTNTNLYLDNGGAGGASLQIGVTGSTSTYINSVDAHPLLLLTSNTERMRITSGGNVGIGTTTPGSKLSIVGLPTSSAGLSSGDIWNDGGTLKIV